MTRPSAMNCTSTVLLPTLVALLPMAASAGTAPEAPAPQAPPALVREVQLQDSYQYASPHFAFFCSQRADMAAMERIARLFENTREACMSLPLGGAIGGGPHHVHILRDQEHFLNFVGHQYAGVPGMYMKGWMILPAETLGLKAEGDMLLPAPGQQPDTDTITHELTHQLTLCDATWDTPTWLGEGLAEYMRLAAHRQGEFNLAGVADALPPYIVEGPRSRRLGRELNAPPLEQFMNLSRVEFNQARGKAGQFNYGFATLLTWYFLHLDGAGDAAALKAWMQHQQTTPKATAHLRYELSNNATDEEIAAERRRLMQLILTLREDYHYTPLLAGRSWQELEEEISRKVNESLGIQIRFGNTPTTP